jgi:molecular chaperone DnaK (HSP70)
VAQAGPARRLILVVDLGGGTTDFSLIAVVEHQGDLGLQRVAVGDHILLGGDNMDLALAHALEQKLAKAGKKIDRWQFLALTHGARQAKEALFADRARDAHPISIPGRGSSLVGGAIKTELTREELNGRWWTASSPRWTRRRGRWRSGAWA